MRLVSPDSPRSTSPFRTEDTGKSSWRSLQGWWGTLGRWPGGWTEPNVHLQRTQDACGPHGRGRGGQGRVPVLAGVLEAGDQGAVGPRGTHSRLHARLPVTWDPERTAFSGEVPGPMASSHCVSRTQELFLRVFPGKEKGAATLGSFNCILHLQFP